jgi:hypothetical protein
MRTAIALAFALVAACTTGNGATPDAALDGAKPTPVACDGALCDTTNSASCSAGEPTLALWLALPLVAVARRRRR